MDGASLKPGDSFGRYTIEALLGQGGMGRVYRARDEQLQRAVALKVLRVTAARREEAERAPGAGRLLREARAAAAIEHVNAVSIHDVGEIDGTPFITMELVDGASLRAYVGDASVTIEKRLGWLVDVASALHAAHARGIIHRDVKPENVMVRRDGVVKVLDFGIARLETQDDDNRTSDATPGAARGGGESCGSLPYGSLSTEATWAGTPRYMAPEQMQGGSIDIRADEFSWGVLAYELLTGRAPWTGDAASLALVASICSSEPDSATLLAVCSPAVAHVVLRAMSKDRTKRFASMRDVAVALDDALAPRRSRRLAALVIASTLLVAAALGLAARSGTFPSRAPALASSAHVSPAPRTTLPMSSLDHPPHIVLVLDAAKGVIRSGATVTKWEDQSGSGNDAVGATLAPTWEDGVIGGRPAIRFDRGQHMLIADAISLQFGTEDFAIEIVARHTRPAVKDVTSFGMTTSYGTLLSKTEGPTPYRGLGLFVNYPQPVPGTRLGVQTSFYNYVVSESEGLNDGKPHLFGARRYGSTLEARVDGIAEAVIPTASDDVSAIGRPAFIGAQPQARGIIQQLQGDIAEIVVVRGDISPESFAELEAELKSRFGIR